MGRFWDYLTMLWEQYIWLPISQFNWTDALDIIVLASLCYWAYAFIKVRRAGKLAVGLIVVLLLYAISGMMGLDVVHQILGSLASFGIIVIVVIFQPELRDALEKLGSTSLGLRSTNAQERADMAHTVSEVADAACQIAMSEQDGGLIVIERSTKLGDYADKGQLLDAKVSGNLLRNIFVNRSPLHDGAVVIRNNRIAAAGCKLPLTENEEVARGLGTRHRAAIGITEVSDCVVVVISEEKHIISIANAGLLKRGYNNNAHELRDEEQLKDVQNELRQDLFLLLAGSSFDGEIDRKCKKKKKKAKAAVDEPSASNDTPTVG